PGAAPADSLYFISPKNNEPQKASLQQKQNNVWESAKQYNSNRTAYAHQQQGDIYYTLVKTGKPIRLVRTADIETNPQFSFNDSMVVYQRNQNLYGWVVATGETVQLTRIQPGNATAGRGGTRPEPESAQDKWLKQDQLNTFLILRERKEKRDATDAYNKALPKEPTPRVIDIEDKNIQSLSISADGRFIAYRLFKMASNKTTIVPNYVTESGYTTDIITRTKVGQQAASSELFIYDRLADSLISFKNPALPGMQDLPDYAKDLPGTRDKISNRGISFSNITWSPAGHQLLVEIRSQDNKDRWLATWQEAGKPLKLADRQRDEAWVGGPANFSRGWINNETIWFVSEATGYSHLYTVNVKTGAKKALTSGKFEVQDVTPSANKKFFYISSNEVHPGEKHFYRLPAEGGKAIQLTSMEGNNDVTLSPDESTLAILYSYSNKPTELYLQPNAAGAKAVQVTNLAQSAEFKSYAWRNPELISIKASDGASVYARLYRSAKAGPVKPAVIFVHGAGYLQNAHKWWSSYFREYMFHNLLADEGYTVLDIDYRGSAGYGRDWRTGIYRHMGGKDLTDHVDAAKYLTDSLGIDKNRIGIYGGSYGGFITLMAMFTKPGVFAAGAALRPVTDWANYNHGYTSNILNEPFTDTLAYRRSSPLYFADGLQGHLLMCHGMLDVNVHYQDVVKLTQRLIELKKENWELASYPMEDHGFVEPSSWTDEYKRIFKLFEQVLKK
ncbi:MAG: S9 family peptidase, partial [Chitinophagaceae bacterium]